MNASATIGALRDMSPKVKARLAGTFYLITMLGGVFAQGFVSDQLVVASDAAATARNIQTHEPLFRLGFAIYLIEMACQITMTVLFYDLLKPVGKSISLLAATFGLIGCTVKTLSRLFFSAPLLVLGGAPYLSVFSAEQLHALAFLFLRMNYQAETIAMVFFGFYTLLNGYLIYRSGFLPRALGVVSAAGGSFWLTYLYEPLAVRLLPIILAVAALGAFSLVLWLLVVGVNEQRWNERAGAAAASRWK